MSKQAELLAKLQAERLTSNTKTTAPKPDTIKEKALEPVLAPKPVEEPKKSPKKKQPVKDVRVTKSMFFRQSDLERIDKLMMVLLPRGLRPNASLVIRAAICSVDTASPAEADAFAELVRQLQSEDGRRKNES